MLTPNVKEYFIKNLGRDEKQKEQLIGILSKDISFLKYCSTTQLIGYLASVDIISRPIANETIHQMSDEHIETIIKFSNIHTAYINAISPEQLDRFISNNKEYIKYLDAKKIHSILKKNPEYIKYLDYDKIPPDIVK